MKQRLTQAVHDAVGQIENLVVGQVAQVMSRDDTEFKMARFPQFIQVRIILIYNINYNYYKNNRVVLLFRAIKHMLLAYPI